MKRLLIASLLFAAVLVGCVWSVNTVRRETNNIVNCLEQGDPETAYARWQQAEAKFGALLMHDELDDIDRLFVRLLHGQPGTELYTLDEAELAAQIRTLPEYEMPSLKNVF